MSTPTSPGAPPPAWQSLLERFKLPAGTQGVHESLRNVTVDQTVLQEFRPLAESLEWELAEHYWATRGVAAFVSNEVPNLVHNSGRASEDAATLLYANCLETAEPRGPIRVLELGAGLGLFARYFLDAFRQICAQEGQDFYDRLVYVVSDRSRRSVEQWQEQALFAAHAGHAVLAVADALRPTEARGLAGEQIDLGGLQAVFVNYLLDVLPSAIVRTGPAGPEQLCVRTHLTAHRPLLAHYTGLDVEEVRALASSPDPAQRARLLPLLTLLEFEPAFRPAADGAVPHLAEALAFAQGRDRVVLSHGAIDCLEQCLRLLRPEGFVLISDYGPTEREQVASHAAVQRFGSTTAVGVNFPLLEHYFASAGRTVVKPEGDQGRSIHTRLLCAGDCPRTRAAFENRYSTAAVEHFEGPAADARRQAAASRYNEALEGFRTALARSPRDWMLIGQAAEFVALQLRDFPAGLELVRAAIELNPLGSPWLWNVLGDCLYCQERFAEAHDAYEQAARIDPQDVRTQFNLSYSHFQLGRFDEALDAIARAFAHDWDGSYRQRLLEKQQQILGALSGRWLGEQERLQKRLAVYTCGG